MDNMLLISKLLGLIQQLKKDLDNCFKIKDLGEVSTILGIQVTRDHQRQSMTLCQSQYTLDLLKRFRMENSTPVAVPMAASFPGPPSN